MDTPQSHLLYCDIPLIVSALCYSQPVSFRDSLLRCHLRLEAAKPLPKSYPTAILSLGDHIRRHRLDLGLLQREVAECIGVTPDTITNWELARTEPGIRCYPAIIEFLGYVPFSPGESFPERLKAYRMLKGSSQRQLAQELGVDPTSVMKWESGKSLPRQKRLEQVLGCVNSGLAACR